MCGFMCRCYLSKLIESAVVFLDIVLLEPLNGLTVVHPLEGPLRRLKVLENPKKMIYLS